MRNDLTDITLVVDRSGSMGEVQSDAEGGINAFLRQQAEQPGEALLTLVQFDTEYEFLCRGVPIGEVPEYRLVPRGMTALLDAVGRAIHETGERLARIDERDRPGLVLFVVMTDGHENSSREFTNEQVKQLIERQRSQYNWHFTFLGADAASFDEARNMGIQASSAAVFRKSNVAGAFAAVQGKVARMRSQARENTPVDDAFTDEEREQMS
jgi:hypothetical protein